MADSWESLPDVERPKHSTSWESLPDAKPSAVAHAQPLPGASTVSDDQIKDFLQNKRTDLPGPVEPARAKAALNWFNNTPGELQRKARSEAANNKANDLGAVTSALDFPSLGMTARMGEIAGVGPREKTQKLLDQATDDHPYARIAGALLTAPISAESTAGRIAVGGMQSGVSALMKADDKHAVRDTGVGTALGVGGTAAIEALTHGGSKFLSPALQKLAQSQAIRALNPLKRDVTMLANQGIEGGVAKDLLSSGVMLPFSNSANIAKRVAPKLEERGAEVAGARSVIDDKAGGDVVDPRNTADSLRGLAGEYRKLPHPEMQSIADDLENRASLFQNSVSARGTPRFSLTEAEEQLKQPLDQYAEKAARTAGTAPDKLEAMAQARRVIKEGNEQAAEAIDPDAADAFKRSKQAYGRMASIADILERNNPRALANRGLQPSDYGFGIATGQGYRAPASKEGEELGEKAVNGLYGMIAAALHKQVRERGNSTLAHVANVASKGAELSPEISVPLSRLTTLAGNASGLANTKDPQSPELQSAIADWNSKRERKDWKANHLADGAGKELAKNHYAGLLDPKEDGP